MKHIKSWFLEWIMIFGCGVAGAAMVASNSSLSKWGYWLFICSSVGTVSVALKDKRYSIIATNFIFICINIFGIYSFMFRDSDMWTILINRLSSVMS